MTTDTKLQKPAGQIQTQPNQGLSVRSLDDLPADLKNAGEPEYLAICGDISGSMSGSYNGKQNRIEGLRSAFKAIWEITDWSICNPEAWAFCDYPTPVNFTENSPPEVPGVRGGTGYRTILQEALKNPKRNRIIFASDGEPTDCEYPTEEIRMCQERGITIDTIYIGDNEYGSGAEKLQRMANDTGGTFTLCRNAGELVQQFQQLETSNRLMIGYDPGDEGGGTINL